MTHLTIAGLFGLGLTALASATLASAAPPAPAAGDATKGKAVFARCSVCHKIDKAAAGGIGPNLAGVYNRTAGQLPGYAYSPAMKASGLKWNDATLSRYLAGPTKVVPGTKMLAPPVASEQDRTDLIAYLKTASAGKK
jgi:cytochrome c